jgi:hypothetical protein
MAMVAWLHGEWEAACTIMGVLWAKYHGKADIELEYTGATS